MLKDIGADWREMLNTILEAERDGVEWIYLAQERIY